MSVGETGASQSTVSPALSDVAEELRPEHHVQGLVPRNVSHLDGDLAFDVI